MLLQGSYQTLSFYKFNYTDFKDRPTLLVKRSLFTFDLLRLL